MTNTCNRKDCDNPKLGSQFCKDHSCASPGCNNGPKKGETLCGPHLTQAYDALEEENYGHDPHCPLSPCICHVSDQEEEPISTRITITGHRPSKLGGYDSNDPLNVAVKEALRARMRSAVEKFGNVVFNIGMALGVDQMAAEICVEEGWVFDAYLPCRNQEKPWPTPAQRHYHELLEHARNKHYTHDGEYPGVWVLQKRNEQLIDGVDGVQTDYLLSVYDGTGGGTARCIAYANRKGFKEENRWVNIDPRQLTKGA